jgi:hypothetical protein
VPFDRLRITGAHHPDRVDRQRQSARQRRTSTFTVNTVDSSQMGCVLEFYHQDQWRRHDRHRWISLLLVAVIVGFTGVLTNAGPDHLLTENFSL